MSAALRKTEGPASVGALPDRGSTLQTPSKDQKMNKTEDNTGSTEVPALSRRRFLGSMAVIATPSLASASLDTTIYAATAKDRAEHHWQQFAAAMDELTRERHGWLVQGGHRLPFMNQRENRWSNRRAIEYRVDNDPRFSKPFVSEHHVQADLGGTGI